MATRMRVRIPVLMLLGIVFLASSVSLSYGIAYWEREKPCHEKCVLSCNKENDAYRQNACQARCNLIHKNFDDRECEEEEKEWEEREEHSRHWEPKRPRGRQEEEEWETREEREEHSRHRDERQPWQPRHHPQEREGEQEEEVHQERRIRREERQRGSRRESEDEDEDEDEDERGQSPEERERERRREKKEQRQERGQEEGSGSSESRRSNNNPFLFRSNSRRFQTIFKNEYGSIRLLQPFDERSKHRFQHLRKVRVAELRFKPNTLLLPHHADADIILAILSGRALITIVNPKDSDSYNLVSGDAIRIPAGTTFYLINPDDNQNLRAVKLAISVNGFGQIKDFNPSESEYQESYFRGFSRKFLEASFNADFKEIQKELFGQEQQQSRGRQSQQQRFIVRVSKEQIRELSKHAKSSSKKSESSENGPFNVRSGNPIYSNNFGTFYEVTPKKNPQLQEQNLFISSVEIKEGGLLVPHYNSRAVSIVVVEEGKGEFQLAVPDELDQEDGQEEDEESREVRRYRGRLSQSDVVVILAGHPVAFNASSDLRLFAFGVNANDNRRNFLAGESDNVLNQIPEQVKGLAFPGSGERVESLIKKQKESHFVSARRQRKGQQQEEGKEGRKGPLSSILGAFY